VAAFLQHAAVDPPHGPPEPLLSLRGITKSFPGIHANDHVDLDLYGGEVHALLGENGAGKSTLMKVLYGFYRADSGEIHIRGRREEIQSPHDAQRLRIGMVFQTFTLIPALTVVENIALFLPRLPAIVDRRQIASRIDEVSKLYGLSVDPWAPVWQLSIGEQQKTEVLKLLLADAQILIFDEPSRVLAPHEIDGLFQVFANLRREGYAIIFITHKLHEVLACADRVTVMRRGRVAGSMSRSEATEERLVSLMFGTAPGHLAVERLAVERPAVEHPAVERLAAQHPVAEHPVVEHPAPESAAQSHRAAAAPAGPAGREPPLLELSNVTTAGEARAVRLRDVSLTLVPGQIIGVAGVSGNGQRELGDVILGLERCVTGTKRLFGADATGWTVARTRARGVAFIPEDPLTLAAVPGLTVQENLALGNTRGYARQGGLAMDWAAVRDDVERTVERLNLTLPPLGAYAGTLSGGNLQRMILAREFARQPRVLVAFYPTRGLDVMSAAAARSLLRAARDAGAGVLLISEDLDELFSLSDRLIVLTRGRIVGTFRPDETTVYDVGLLMTREMDSGGARG
jgi:simple sugar transport system ATP-binding protein